MVMLFRLFSYILLGDVMLSRVKDYILDNEFRITLFEDRILIVNFIKINWSS